MVEVFRPRLQEISRGTEGVLPEAKIFDLLSSVGNGEHHAQNLIVMRKRVVYSEYAFYKEVVSHQEKDRRWRMNMRTPFKHCDTLSRIGLVAKEALYPDGSTWGYQITPYGLRTGVPFAGLLLKWSYEHPEHSLYKMFGSTQSTSIKDQQTLEKKDLKKQDIESSGKLPLILVIE